LTVPTVRRSTPRRTGKCIRRSETESSGSTPSATVPRRDAVGVVEAVGAAVVGDAAETPVTPVRPVTPDPPVTPVMPDPGP
jgi:hypothetical protein